MRFNKRYKNSVTVYLKSSKGNLQIEDIIKDITEDEIIVKSSANIKILNKDDLLYNPPSQFSVCNKDMECNVIKYIEISKGQIRYMHILYSIEVLNMLECNILHKNF